MFCSGKMVPRGDLPTILKPLSSTSSSDTNIETYLRLAVMSLEAGTLWKLKWRGWGEQGWAQCEAAGFTSHHPPRRTRFSKLQSPSKFPLIAKRKPAHPAVCIQWLGKGRAISILLPARRVALMQINYHIRFTLLSSTDWLPNCFRWLSLILSIG